MFGYVVQGLPVHGEVLHESRYPRVLRLHHVLYTIQISEADFTGADQHVEVQVGSTLQDRQPAGQVDLILTERSC